MKKSQGGRFSAECFRKLIAESRRAEPRFVITCIPGFSRSVPSLSGGRVERRRSVLGLPDARQRRLHLHPALRAGRGPHHH